MGTHSGHRWASATPVCLLVLVLAFTLQTRLRAQCQGPQIPALGALGAQAQNGAGRIDLSTVWDPDGAGPLPEQIVVKGDFDMIGQTPITGMAMFEPSTGTWTSMPTPANPAQILVLLTTPSGRLFAMRSNDVYEWNGTQWLSRTIGPFIAAFTLGLNSAGNIVLSGYQPGLNFGISELVGNQWTPPVALPPGTAAMRDIIPYGTGFVARSNLDVILWDGATWSTLPAGPWALEQVTALATDGTLIHAAGSWGVATWNGSSWQVQFPHATQRIAIYNGDLIAAGPGLPSSTPGLVNISSVQTIGGGISNGGLPQNIQVLTLTPTQSGELFVGGSFRQAGTTGVGNAALWDGSSWMSMGDGWNGTVNTAARLGNGGLLVGGDFTSPGGAGTAIWDGQAWQTAGSGFGGTVIDMTRMPNGNVAAIGQRLLGGQILPEVSVFDGTSWTDLTFPDSSAELRAIAALQDGTLVVGGKFQHPTTGTSLNLMTYDGAWNIVADFQVQELFNTSSAPVQDLHVLDNGDLVVAGAFSQAGVNFVNSLAIWDGNGWLALPPISLPQARIRRVSGTDENNLVLTMDNPLGVLERDGTNWQQITTDATLDAQLRPDGFISAVFPTSRQVFDGNTWQVLPDPFDGDHARIIPTSQGTMLVGSFRSSSPLAVNFQDISEPCTALVTHVGTGCSALGQPAALFADTSPWTGVTLELRTSDFPVQTFQLLMLSTTLATVPLPQLTPLSLPGCSLYVTPDFVDVASIGQSQAEYDIPIPNMPALAGMNFSAQVLGLEYYGAFVLAQATTSNALDMIIGTF